MGATTTLMTFEEFERLPDEDVKLELLDGELHRMPPADMRHMLIAFQVAKALDRAVEALRAQGRAAELGKVVVEGGYRIGSGWLIPDASITHATQTVNKYAEGAPILAVEIVSDANSARALHRKVRRYLEAGAHEVWLVYPETSSVAIYRGRTSVEVEGTLTSDLLPDEPIDLGPVFA